jgi:conserved repeat domain
VGFQAVVDKLPAGETEKVFSNFAIMNEAGNNLEYPPTNTVTHKTITRAATIEKAAALLENGTAQAEANGSAVAPVETARKQVIEYRLVVKNTGAEEIKSGNLTITDSFPAGTTFVAGSMTATFRDSSDPDQAFAGSSASVVSETNTASGVEWVLDGLSSGEEAYLTFRVTAPVTTDNPATTEVYETEFVFTNKASLHDKVLSETTYETTYTDKDGKTHTAGSVVYSEEEYKKDSNTTYHVVKEPLVNAVKTSNPVSPMADGSIPVVKAGDTITYSIAVTNTGAGEAKNVKVRDYVPVGTAYVAGSANASGSMNTVTVDGVQREKVDWIIPSIGAGDTVVVSFQVTVQA